MDCDQMLAASKSGRRTIGDCLRIRGINFEQEYYVPFVVDAVTVVAQALDAYIKVIIAVYAFWSLFCAM